MLYPLTFTPNFKERIWGGRELERLYGKPLPPQVPIGESWEICDRPGDVSLVSNGPLEGRSLRWLMENCAGELLGNTPSSGGLFPLLIKVLDAREKLSLQVHPPAAKATELGGEPKTEMWYVADAVPGAELYAGLRKGVTRADFEEKARSGGIEDCFHRLPVKSGDAMFLPSGRVHAIGSGLVIFEIQQNSDTTYRVFDWNRSGLDGQPRELHVAQSLASINFGDFEPRLVRSGFTEIGALLIKPMVRHQLFSVDGYEFADRATLPLAAGKMQIIGLVSGSARVAHPDHPVRLAPGGFALVPAGVTGVSVEGCEGSFLLRIQAGEGGGPGKSLACQDHNSAGE